MYYQELFSLSTLLTLGIMYMCMLHVACVRTCMRIISKGAPIQYLANIPITDKRQQI